MFKEEDGLPATYQAPLRSRLTPLYWLVPLYLVAMGGRVHLNAKSPAWLWIVAIFALAALILMVLSTGFCRITLCSDRVERTTWFGTKVMARSDVGGVRKRGLGLTIIYYKYNKGDGIVIPRGLGGDPVWNDWMDNTIGQDKQGH